MEARCGGIERGRTDRTEAKRTDSARCPRRSLRRFRRSPGVSRGNLHGDCERAWRPLDVGHKSLLGPETDRRKSAELGRARSEGLLFRSRSRGSRPGSGRIPAARRLLVRQHSARGLETPLGHSNSSKINSRKGHIVPRRRSVVLYTFLGFVATFGYATGLFRRTVAAQSVKQGAYADILSPVEEKLGTAHFFPVEDGVRIELDVIQQVPGLHALRILTVGKCDGPDFASAGQPFPPAGDLPNVEAGLDGHLQTTIVAKGLTLGEGQNSLFHPGGTAIVIDENPGDYNTKREKNSGPHVACGVIRKNSAATGS
jgi:superoxide dismutase, Cu-Zn family